MDFCLKVENNIQLNSVVVMQHTISPIHYTLHELQSNATSPEDGFNVTGQKKVTWPFSGAVSAAGRHQVRVTQEASRVDKPAKERRQYVYDIEVIASAGHHRQYNIHM